MKFDLQIDSTSSVPRWVQIRDGLMGLVARGELKAGSPVPSQKEVASKIGTNPATVAKAYQRLVQMGVFVTKRGQGTLISESVATSGKPARHRVLRKEAMRFASRALVMGADIHESLHELEADFRRLAPEESDQSW